MGKGLTRTVLLAHGLRGPRFLVVRLENIRKPAKAPVRHLPDAEAAATAGERAVSNLALRMREDSRPRRSLPLVAALAKASANTIAFSGCLHLTQASGCDVGP